MLNSRIEIQKYQRCQNGEPSVNYHLKQCKRLK